MKDAKTDNGGGPAAPPRAERSAAALVSQYIHELSAAAASGEATPAKAPPTRRAP